MHPDLQHTALRPLRSVEDVAWMDGAACRDMPVEQFYPSRGTRGIWAVEAACEVCRGCPVQAECLLDALRRGERYGVWGGMQERTRRRVRVRWLRELRRLTRSAG